MEEAPRVGDVARTHTITSLLSENSTMVGFENPGKALYSLTRELIENSLDALEMVDIDDPYIKLSIEELDGKGNIAQGKKRFKITCEDNGIGMKHEDIPNSFAQYGFTLKRAHRQSRGKLGVGLKNAIVYATKTTYESVVVESSMMAQKSKSLYTLKIHPKSGPQIISESQVPKPDSTSHGTKVEFVIVGNWKTHKNKILSYFEQTAMVTPYVQIELRCVLKDGLDSVIKTYHRHANQKPEVPKVSKFDPSSISEGLTMFVQKSESRTIFDFLQNEFANVDSEVAHQFIEKLGPTFSAETCLEGLTTEQMNAMISAFEAFNFGQIDTSCLVPLGDYLTEGVKNYLGDDILIASATKGSLSYCGHPYILEVTITVGGKEGANLNKGLNFFRFANRAPLLYEQGSDVDVITKEAKKLKWKEYSVDQQENVVSIFFSFVSTHVPFAGVSKEVIGEEASIPSTIKAILEECCGKLKVLLMERKKQMDKEKISKLIPKAAYYHLKLVEGCTTMEDSSGTNFNKDYAERKFGSEAKRLKTQREYELSLDDYVRTI